MISKKNITKFDEILYKILVLKKKCMPKRVGKIIAMYYTDARVRKLYASFLGVEMSTGTFANLGMKVVPNDSDVCVHIGRNVSIAPNVTFVCHSSANNGVEINQYSYVNSKLTKKGDIFVEDEVWIGANVIILPGVRVGRCSVIGAGSIVINDILPYSVYAGSPAKRIRDLKTGQKK